MDFTYNWVHNLFVLWVLGFLLWVVIRLETQSLTLVFATSSLSLKTTPPSFGIVPLLSVCSSQNCQPLPSKHVLLFIARGEWRCHDYTFTRVNRGPIPSFLSGCFVEKVVMALELISTSKGPLGNDILEGITGQDIPEQ